MKILTIFYDLDIGGAQNYTIALINEFVKLGHEVKLLVLSENLLLRDRLVDKINCVVLPRKHKLDLFVLKKIRYELKYGKFDVAISFYIIYYKLANLFLINKIPVIYPLHSTTAKSIIGDIFSWLSVKLKTKNETYLTSIDSQTNYLTQHYSLKDGFFKQIYNGVDTNKFVIKTPNLDRVAFLSSLGLNPNFKVILMVAGFRREKRHEDAIAAFELLKNENPEIN